MSAASDAASVAADSIAWAIMASPSRGISLSAYEKALFASKAKTLIDHYRDDAESDPNTFAQDLFKSLVEITMEYNRDIEEAQNDRFQ